MAVHQFQTEVTQLLDLIINSLYSHREIFLRELVSNASDAIDKLKYLSVSDEAYKDVSFDPCIRITYDTDAGTMTLSDNGIGMNEQDLIDNLGTIARSGTRKFMDAMAADQRKDSNLIGRFGVGFYASYMVCDLVTVTSRKANEADAFVWTSDGKGSYTIEKASREEQGTTIVLKMKDDAKEYLSNWRIEQLIKKYSNHVAYPIRLEYDAPDYDDKGKQKEQKIHKDEQVNNGQALWRRNKNDIKDEEYIDFYKSVADGDDKPLLWSHTKAEGTIEYTTLFYIPETAPFDMYQADYKPGVKLYVRRVFITDDEKELLPTYLRFIRGVIDSEDLPLNVSREILQQNRVMSTIRNGAVKKILTEIKDLASSDKEKFNKLITQYNCPLKEGLYSDYQNRETLLEIIRFKSSSIEGFTSLADYKSRMPESQKYIYYIAGDSEDRLRKSPLLEMYKKQGIEVLICDDNLDDIVVPSIMKYGELELKAVNRVGAEEEFDTKKDEKEQKDKAPIIEKIKKALGDSVKDVRLSARLSESPSCIVVDENDPSIKMQQLLKSMGRGAGIEDIKPILEVNGSHPIVEKIVDADEETTKDIAFVLLNQAMIVEGAPIKDPSDFVSRLNRLLSK